MMAKVELDDEEWRVILWILDEVSMPARISKPLQLKVADQLRRQNVFSGTPTAIAEVRKR